MKSEYKITLTEDDMDNVREAIALVDGIDERMDYGSSETDRDLEDYNSIARWLGNRIINRIRKNPF